MSSRYTKAILIQSSLNFAQVWVGSLPKLDITVHEARSLLTSRRHPMLLLCLCSLILPMPRFLCVSGFLRHSLPVCMLPRRVTCHLSSRNPSRPSCNKPLQTTSWSLWSCPLLIPFGPRLPALSWRKLALFHGKFTCVPLAVNAPPPHCIVNCDIFKSMSRPCSCNHVAVEQCLARVYTWAFAQSYLACLRVPPAAQPASATARAATLSQPRASVFPSLVSEHQQVVVATGSFALPVTTMQRLKSPLSLPPEVRCRLRCLPEGSQLLRVSSVFG